MDWCDGVQWCSEMYGQCNVTLCIILVHVNARGCLTLKGKLMRSHAYCVQIHLHEMNSNIYIIYCNLNMYNFHHLGMLCAFWLPQGPTCPSCRQHLRWNTGALVPPMAAVGLPFEPSGGCLCCLCSCLLRKLESLQHGVTSFIWFIWFIWFICHSVKLWLAYANFKSQRLTWLWSARISTNAKGKTEKHGKNTNTHVNSPMGCTQDQVCELISERSEVHLLSILLTLLTPVGTNFDLLPRGPAWQHHVSFPCPPASPECPYGDGEWWPKVGYQWAYIMYKTCWILSEFLVNSCCFMMFYDFFLSIQPPINRPFEFWGAS